MNTKFSIHTDASLTLHDTGPGHPERPARWTSIHDALKSADFASRLTWASAPPATDEAILTCHTPGHLARVRKAAGGQGRLDADTAYSPQTVRAALLAAGNALQAAEACLRTSPELAGAFALVRPPGHHATPDKAMGFCFFNNAALAARHAQGLGARKVLIVDWDVHHGNGTQDIFYDDPTVFYYSLHLHPHYPGTGLAHETGKGKGVGTTLNRPLPRGFTAAQYRQLFTIDIETIHSQFKPDFAILSCGLDSHRLDPLGGLELEELDFGHLTRIVLERLPRGRVMSVLEGGYNLEVIGPSAVSHVRAFLELP